MVSARLFYGIRGPNMKTEVIVRKLLLVKTRIFYCSISFLGLSGSISRRSIYARRIHRYMPYLYSYLGFKTGVGQCSFGAFRVLEYSSYCVRSTVVGGGGKFADRPDLWRLSTSML